MGLLGSIGSGISSIANSPIGYTIPGYGQYKLASDIVGQTPPDPKSMVNSVDPRLQKMRDDQTQAAIDYKNNLQGYEAQQHGAAADTSRSQLAQQLAGVTANSNSRGMLYGSYNRGQQAKATEQSAAGLAQTNANINTGAQNTLSQLQNQALGTGVTINQTQQAQNDAAYQMALQEQLSNNQAFGSILGAAGRGAGLMAAG